MRSLRDDVRYALRALRRNPILTSVAVLSLAVGIGANTAIFSFMDRMLFRSLAVRDPQRLVLLRSPGGWSGSIDTMYGDDVSFSWPKYRALDEESGAVFDGLLARCPFTAGIAARGRTDAGRGEMVTGNYFELLGVRPALGRLIDAGDTARSGNRVAVLSYAYWTSRIGGDPAALNQSITVNGTALTIVGVAQAGFRSIGAGESPEVFVPITLVREMNPTWAADPLPNAHAYWLNIFGRLKPRISREQAAASLDVAWRRVLAGDANALRAGSDREKYLHKPLELSPAGNGISSIRNDFESALYLLMGMVGLVLLIACANVANLLLARAVARGREMAIRISLGASRGRLIRHVLVESVILSLGGGALGLVIASWAGQLLLGMLPANLPLAGIGAEIDGRVLAFTFAVSVATGLLFGCAPAWNATRTDVAPVLKEGVASPTAHARFRRVLVAGQIAISALLLASAGLFAHSLRNLRTLDPGFRAGGIDTFSISPRLVGYSAERSLRLGETVRNAVASAPGVAGVATAKWPLLTDSMDVHGFEVEGYPAPEKGGAVTVSDNTVSPGFFSVLGIPLVAGREFRESDTAGALPVAVVNETFARKYCAGRNPIGLHLTWRLVRVAFEIAGVVKDAKYDDLRESPKPFVYLAAAQDPESGPLTFYVRSALAPNALAATVRAIMRRLDASLPVNGPERMDQQILESVSLDRMVAALGAGFAVLATALAAIGLYGVVAWTVSRRRREIGIRMALGAAPGAVVRMVMAEVLRLGGAGLLVAIPLWAMAGRLLRTLLFGVTERDPTALAGAAVLLVIAALAAGLVPAWRAARIDPSSAIRQD